MASYAKDAIWRLVDLVRFNNPGVVTVYWEGAMFFAWICESSMLGKSEPKIFSQLVVKNDDLRWYNP